MSFLMFCLRASRIESENAKTDNPILKIKSLARLVSESEKKLLVNTNDCG